VSQCQDKDSLSENHSPDLGLLKPQKN